MAWNTSFLSWHAACSGLFTHSDVWLYSDFWTLCRCPERRADWRIASDFAQCLEKRMQREGATLFPYASAESIFNEHRASTVGRDLDIGGLSYALLDSIGPQQWPMREAVGTLCLYRDGVFPTASGRAHFKAVVQRPTAESTDARLPLHLNSGRLRDQWHGMSRTGIVPRLIKGARLSFPSFPQNQVLTERLSRRSLNQFHVLFQPTD